ncbi:hypothetical protein E2P81_ATG04150 [Venturia nashicola]|nr:hypothetical protein E2P81_ATG04150 [Venturia nashicola]
MRQGLTGEAMTSSLSAILPKASTNFLPPRRVNFFINLTLFLYQTPNPQPHRCPKFPGYQRWKKIRDLRSWGEVWTVFASWAGQK